MQKLIIRIRKLTFAPKVTYLELQQLLCSLKANTHILEMRASSSTRSNPPPSRSSALPKSTAAANSSNAPKPRNNPSVPVSRGSLNVLSSSQNVSTSSVQKKIVTTKAPTATRAPLRSIKPLIVTPTEQVNKSSKGAAATQQRRVPISSRLQRNPAFRRQEEAFNLDQALKQARRSGCLRIQNQKFPSGAIPREVFFINQLKFENESWWEYSHITSIDLDNNELLHISPPAPTPDEGSEMEGKATLDHLWHGLERFSAVSNHIKEPPADLFKIESLSSVDLR